MGDRSTHRYIAGQFGEEICTKCGSNENLEFHIIPHSITPNRMGARCDIGISRRLKVLDLYRNSCLTETTTIDSGPICSHGSELDPWYDRFKPGNQKVSGWKTGKPGIGFWFRLRSRYLQATVTIEDTGIDRIEYYWNQLKDKQNSIDSELPIKPQWEPARGRITASRIG